MSVSDHKAADGPVGNLRSRIEQYAHDRLNSHHQRTQDARDATSRWLADQADELRQRKNHNEFAGRLGEIRRQAQERREQAIEHPAASVDAPAIRPETPDAGWHNEILNDDEYLEHYVADSESRRAARAQMTMARRMRAAARRAGRNANQSRIMAVPQFRRGIAR